MVERLLTGISGATLEFQQGFRKTWVTVDSGTYVSGSQNDTTVAPLMIWRLKHGLVSSPVGRWTVIASSGKAGGASLIASTDDNWTSSSDLVRGSSSSADRSWVLLKSPRSPKGPYYLLIDYWHASSDSYCQIYFTNSQPDVSSPATNSRPPSTGYEWSYANEPFHGTSNTNLGGTRSYLFQAHDGSFVFAGLSGTGYGGGSTAPFFRSIFVFNVLRWETLISWDTVGAASIHCHSLSQNMIVSDTYRWKTLHTDGSTVNLAQVRWYTNSTTDSIRSTHTSGFSNSWWTLPIWLSCVDSGKQCVRGVVEDIVFSSEDLYDGSLLFQNEVVKAVKVGCWIVPNTSKLLI